jgi:peptidoglycan/xylan/chitin deacetylase (PgdA/CDA1 family)
MSARTLAIVGIAAALLVSPAAAGVNDCPGRADAIGTSRIITIDPARHPHVGTMQYSDTLPLDDKEVVLTFDDGPLPPYTNRVLEILATQCVKANYFVIGRMARGYPDLLRRIYSDGHVVGTHSENHPLAFDRMALPAVQREIEQGIATVAATLGRPNAVAPFFRIPGLLRSNAVDGYLRTRRLVTFSADVAGDDWKHVSARDVVRRIITRLDEKGRGIVLLHDIQPATALALPNLLKEMKNRGYRIVQVRPVGDAPRLARGAQDSPQAASLASAWPTAMAPPRPTAKAMPPRTVASAPQPVAAESQPSAPKVQATAAPAITPPPADTVINREPQLETPAPTTVMEQPSGPAAQPGGVAISAEPEPVAKEQAATVTHDTAQPAAAPDATASPAPATAAVGIPESNSSPEAKPLTPLLKPPAMSLPLAKKVELPPVYWSNVAMRRDPRPAPVPSIIDLIQPDAAHPGVAMSR